MSDPRSCSLRCVQLSVWKPIGQEPEARALGLCQSILLAVRMSYSDQADLPMSQRWRDEMKAVCW